MTESELKHVIRRLRNVLRSHCGKCESCVHWLEVSREAIGWPKELDELEGGLGVFTLGEPK